jgi:hypothetical protein
MNFQKRLIQTRFDNWLNESVYSGPGISTAPRQTVLYQFTLDLIDFHKKFGYSITRRPVDVARDLVRFIFKTKLVSCSKIKFNKNNEERPEDYDMYCYLFDTDRWAGFLNEWKSADDFSICLNGEKALQAAPLFAWFHVNIMTSGPTQKVDDIMRTGESDDETGYVRKPKAKSDDPYITDLANAVNKQNRWD